MKSSCNSSCWYICQSKKPTIGNFYTGYFTRDNEPGGIENATHNTSGGKVGYLHIIYRLHVRCTFQCIVGCIFYSAGLIITREIPCILGV
jgi:hypothetical protein